jgi:hypothetical protein
MIDKVHQAIRFFSASWDTLVEYLASKNPELSALVQRTGVITCVNYIWDMYRSLYCPLYSEQLPRLVDFYFSMIPNQKRTMFFLRGTPGLHLENRAKDGFEHAQED